MGEMTNLIDRFCDAWNEQDRMKRWTELDALLADDAIYQDSTIGTIGREALNSHIGSVQSRRRGASVTRVGEVQAHHDVGYFLFEVRSITGALVLSGMDYFELDMSHERLHRITGFSRDHR